ncbi:autotransporter domain-containing protein [Methylobacillus gramineus]|uniref:autotransporter family protein n=1 Tax=Methylobacillus gramineus TaxID=755169 RepID=UPI001CFF6FDC|nr:autotransporter domain-containing protein [Methylobacillus gramineus]MCB5184050.1 autotransporter domain-containing protein [Methylobacillus gramineus]
MGRASLHQGLPLAGTHANQVMPAITFKSKRHRQLGNPPRQIVVAVMATLGIFGAVTAQASCGTINSATIISTAETGPCTLGAGTYDLTVTGVVTAGGDAIEVNGNMVGSIINSGHINGAGKGIAVFSNSIGDIHNSGTIEGGDYAIAADFGGGIGHITNSDTIAGGNYGIYASSGSTIGDISNSGTITGNNNDGIYIASDSQVGNIVNSGIISGGVNSINIDKPTLTGEIQVEGNDTARFDGAVLASGYTMRVMSGASYSLVGDERFTVTSLVNNGTLKLAENSLDTAIVNGNFETTNTLVTRVTDTTYGKLSVTGTVTLGGSLLVDAASVTSANSYSNGLLANVVAGQSRTGEFTSVSDNSTLFNFTPQYTNIGFDLVMAAAGTSGVYDAVQSSGSRAGTNAARVLDRLIAENPGSTIASLFVPVNGTQAVADAVSQTLPNMQGSMQQTSFSTQNQIGRLIQARTSNLRGAASGDDFLGDRHFWLKSFGSNADQDQRKGNAGYDAETYGIAIGADAEPKANTRLGVAFAYARASVDGNGSAETNQANIQVYQLTGYGSYDVADDTWLDFQLGIGQNRNKGKRDILFANSVAKSSYDSQTANVGIGLNHQIGLTEHSSFIPSVRADYLRIFDEGYTERGADVLNLKVQRNTSEALILSMDGKFIHTTQQGYQLTANAGAGYDVIHDHSGVSAVYVGASATAFTTPGLNQSPWLLRGGLGLSRSLTESVELQARYDAEYRSDFLMQTASLKLRWGF